MSADPTLPDRPDRAGGGEPTRQTGAPGRRRFLLNATGSYGMRGLMALSALLLTPYLFRRLGIGGFGTWSVIFTISTVYSMLEIGFSLGTTKFTAELRAAGRRDDVETTLGASLYLMALLGLVAMATSALVALFASGLAAEGEREDFQIGMLALGAGYMVRLPLVAYGSVLAGYQRYDLYYGSQSVAIVGAALGAVVAVEAGWGVLGVAVAYALAIVVGALGYLILLRRIDPGLRRRPRPSDRVARRRVFGFSSFTLLADSMMFVGTRMDTVVIAAIRNASAAAPFAAALKLQNGIQALTLPVINLMMPMISDLEARGMRDEVIRRLVTATRVTLQVTIPVAVAVALFSSDIVETWLGEGAPAITATIVTLLAAQSVMMSSLPSNKVLLGMGRARAVGIVSTVQGVLNLSISIVLVSSYGAIGAAIGTLVSSVLLEPIYYPLACRATGCRLSRLLGRGVGAAAASSLPSVAVMLGVWSLVPPGTGRFALGLILGGLAAGVVAILQIGPRRAIDELRGGLRWIRPRQEGAAAPIPIQEPS